MISWQDFGKKKKVDQNLPVQVIIFQKKVTRELFTEKNIVVYVTIYGEIMTVESFFGE